MATSLSVIIKLLEWTEASRLEWECQSDPDGEVFCWETKVGNIIFTLFTNAELSIGDFRDNSYIYTIPAREAIQMRKVLVELVHGKFPCPGLGPEALLQRALASLKETR